MDNNIRRSRIHVLVEELNRIASENLDAEPFKQYPGEVFVKEVDELGYRILSVYSLEQEDLMLLPAVTQEMVLFIYEMEAKTSDTDLSPMEVYEIREEIRNLEKEILHEYAKNQAQPWFNLISHKQRLIVWNEAPGHAMNQCAEKYRVNSLLTIRSDFELYLWMYNMLHKDECDEKTFIEYMQDKGLSELSNLQLTFIQACMQGADLKGGSVPFNQIAQIVNTYLIQAIAFNNPDIFRNYIFWAMHDRVKWELRNLKCKAFIQE